MRSQTPRSLCKAFRGDLDWIVPRALEKERKRRLREREQLADEVDRYLCDEPVAASPPQQAVSPEQFARHNRAPFASGVAIAGALVAAVGVLSWSLGETQTVEGLLEGW